MSVVEATGIRQCESCGGALPNRTHRQRNDAGQLVCDSCAANPQPVTGNWTTSHSALSVVDSSEMQRREAEAITSIVRVRRAKHAAADDKSAVYVITVPGQDGFSPTIQWDEQLGKWTCTEEGGRHGVADSPQRLLRTMQGRWGSGITMAPKTGSRRLAHDSGDQAIIHHCPFCGSGAVVGKSDGTATCDFCHSSFTVQVQPAHPFMPQTVDGQDQVPPGMPGSTPEPSELSAPTDPTVEEDEDGVSEDALGDADPNPPSHPDGPGFPPAGKKKPGEEDEEDTDKSENPFAKKDEEEDGGSDGKGKKKNLPPWMKNKKSFRTTEGRTLDEDEYMARLALEFADERDPVLEVVRMGHVQKQAKDQMCPSCKGTGWMSAAGGGTVYDPPETPQRCDYCGGAGMVTAEEAEEFGKTHPTTDPWKEGMVMPPFTAEVDGQVPDLETLPPGTRIYDQQGRSYEKSDSGRWIRRDTDDEGNDKPGTGQALQEKHLKSYQRMRPEGFGHRNPKQGASTEPPGQPSTSKGLVRHQIKATEIKEGDFLDISGKTRVDALHPRTDQVLARTRTRGARTAYIRSWDLDDDVVVWRRA